jgi:hypothetical protein
LSLFGFVFSEGQRRTYSLLSSCTESSSSSQRSIRPFVLLFDCLLLWSQSCRLIVRLRVGRGEQIQDGVLQAISIVQTPASINGEHITSLYSSLRYISPVAVSDRVEGIPTRTVGQGLSFLEETCPFVASTTATSNSELLSLLQFQSRSPILYRPTMVSREPHPTRLKVFKSHLEIT